MHKLFRILEKEAGARVLALGNEAIVRGAIESGLDVAASPYQLQRTAFAHEARQPLGATEPRHDTQLDLRLSELDAVLCEANVAGHGQFIETSQAVPSVDRRNDRLAGLFDL